MSKRSKRSSRRTAPSPPRQKHAKYEHVPTDPQQSVPSPGDLLSINLGGLVSQGLDGDGLLNLIHNHVHSHIHTYRKDELEGRDFTGVNQFKAIVKPQQSEFLEVFRKAAGRGAGDDDRGALLQHDAFWVVPSRPAADELERIASRVSQGKAVERSWTADFVGQRTVTALENHVKQQMTMGKRYARYCSIVQSSGMGKSRLLDEFAKEHFLIPINLRPKGGEGFPPADDQVREFFASLECYQDKDISDSSNIRARRFLKALFWTTATVITKMDTPGDVDCTPSEDGVIERADRIKRFREFMSEGQTMVSSGFKRIDFYRTVVLAAEGKDSPSDDDLLRAFEELRDRVNGKSFSTVQEPALPDVFIVFDEAHPLTMPFDSNEKGSHFVELRRALRVFTEASLFSFFLSTTGKISQFTPPRDRDPSHRMNDGKLKTPRPFVYLGFDQLMANRKIFNKYKTLEDVTSLDCIAHMGRPLWGTNYDYGDDEVRRGLIHFALLKLLCGTSRDKLTEAQKYAVLSQRLPLDINSTTYVPLPSNQVEKEQEQISNHMRVCMSIGDGIETIRGIAASEPMLSEAASLVMSDRRGFNLADVLTDVLGGFGINAGDRAELLVSAFFTWARDRTVSAKPHPQFPGQLSRYFSVKELFSSLFSEPTFVSMSGNMPSLCHTEATRQTFGRVFGDAWMHFNHFIKPHEQRLLARPYLLLFMARGAAAFGANNQPGLDAVYPFLYGGTDLDVQKVGFVIVQVKKNDVGQEFQAEIFKKMDPFACGLLDSSRLSGKFPIPIIRIVFALCTTSNKSGVTHKTYSSPLEGASYLDNDGQPRFTSYDFWCSGIDPDVLQPVDEAPERWKALADKADSWRAFYNGALDPDVLRSQNPGGGSNQSHFDSWSEPILGFEDLFGQ